MNVCEPVNMDDLLLLDYSARRKFYSDFFRQARVQFGDFRSIKAGAVFIVTSGIRMTTEYVLGRAVLHREQLPELLIENIRMLCFSDEHHERDKYTGHTGNVPSWEAERHKAAVERDKAAILQAMEGIEPK